MHCRIICMNDSMMFTIVGHNELAVAEAAKEKMGELKHKYWEQNRHSFENETHYGQVCYWHLHDTQVEIV